MKKGIHPDNYREVAFKDLTSGEVFIVKSTANTEDTIEHKGKKYPLVTVDTSSASHPFYTGNSQSVKTTGRVERFKRMLDKKGAEGKKPAAKKPAAAKKAEAPKKPVAKAPAAKKPVAKKDEAK